MIGIAVIAAVSISDDRRPIVIEAGGCGVDDIDVGMS